MEIPTVASSARVGDHEVAPEAGNSVVVFYAMTETEPSTCLTVYFHSVACRSSTGALLQAPTAWATARR